MRKLEEAEKPPSFILMNDGLFDQKADLHCTFKPSKALGRLSGALCFKKPSNLHC